jgi:hypothetical protein
MKNGFGEYTWADAVKFLGQVFFFVFTFFPLLVLVLLAAAASNSGISTSNGSISTTIR